MRGDEIDRALASAQAGDFAQARAILERAEHERMRAMVKVRHLIISLRPRSNEAFITSMNGVRQIGNDGDYIRVRI